MKRPILLVDAFAERPFAGNPAGVMLLDQPLSEVLMQQIATEMAQAETAFAVRRDGAWDLRWFTPTQEVPFCGHATLATAHALATEAGVTGEILFHTREVGVLRVRIEGGACYTLDVPRRDPEPAPSGPLPADLTSVRSFFGAARVLCLELGSEAEVRAFRPDFGSIARDLPGGLCLTAPGEGTDMASRFFWPSGGIPEDQVTGSLHATLVPYWAARLGRERLSAVQASPRGGRLDCALQDTRVLLTGSAFTTLRGHLDLPD